MSATEPTYDSLAQLRRSLTAEDPDRRANAYGDIMSHDVQPSQVLKTPPEEAAIATLEENSVLPANTSEGGDLTTQEYRHRVVDLLEELVGGDGA